MKKTAYLLYVCLLYVSMEVRAATYVAGTPFTTQLHVGDVNCFSTFYDPEAFLNFDGHLTVLGQANDGGSACTAGMDSIYGSLRNASGAWTNTAEGACPLIANSSTSCFPQFPRGPTASPSVVKIPKYGGFPPGKFYMAYVAGNADFERGRVHWASSDDGKTWSVMGGATPTEIIGPDELGKSACDPHGISQIEVQFSSTDGYFYFFFLYYHYRDGGPGPQSIMMYRIKYDPYAQYGLSTNPAYRQIFKHSQNAWVQHNGKLRFDYDGGPLQVYQWTRNYQWEGDIVRDIPRNRYVHFYTVAGRTLWNETPGLSLDADWSQPIDVNVDAIKAVHGTRYQQQGGVSVVSADLTNDGVSNPTLYIVVITQKIGTCNPPYESSVAIIAPLTYQP